MTDEERSQEREQLFEQMKRSCEELHQQVALLRDMNLQHLHIPAHGRKVMASSCEAVLSILREMDEIDEMLIALYD